MTSTTGRIYGRNPVTVIERALSCKTGGDHIRKAETPFVKDRSGRSFHFAPLKKTHGWPFSEVPKNRFGSRHRRHSSSIGCRPTFTRACAAEAAPTGSLALLPEIACGTLEELSDAAKLPLIFHVEGQWENVDWQHQLTGHDVVFSHLNGKRLELTAPRHRKLEIMRILLAENDIHDVAVEHPTLDNLYAFYSQLRDKEGSS